MLYSSFKFDLRKSFSKTIFKNSMHDKVTAYTQQPYFNYIIMIHVHLSSDR